MKKIPMSEDMLNMLKWMSHSRTHTSKFNGVYKTISSVDGKVIGTGITRESSQWDAYQNSLVEEDVKEEPDWHAILTWHLDMLHSEDHKLRLWKRGSTWQWAIYWPCGSLSQYHSDSRENALLSAYKNYMEEINKAAF